MITKLKSILSAVYEGAVCAITPRCVEMTRLISESQERPQKSLTQLGMNLHYCVCIWCLRYHEQLATIRSFIREFPETEDIGEPLLSEAARERIKETLRESR